MVFTDRRVHSWAHEIVFLCVSVVRLLGSKVSAAANRWNQMHFAVRSDGREPHILEDFSVDGDGVGIVLDVRGQSRIALAQRAQQLLHVARIDLQLRFAARQLLQGSAEDEPGQCVFAG
jgi:hypothetical protein